MSRTITTQAELRALQFGSAVLTSDTSDTVVLRAEGDLFRNQSGYDVTVSMLWQWGTKPFTVLWEPPCPTCSGLIRETVNMRCQTCGRDFMEDA